MFNWLKSWGEFRVDHPRWTCLHSWYVQCKNQTGQFAFWYLEFFWMLIALINCQISPRKTYQWTRDIYSASNALVYWKNEISNLHWREKADSS